MSTFDGEIILNRKDLTKSDNGLIRILLAVSFVGTLYFIIFIVVNSIDMPMLEASFESLLFFVPIGFKFFENKKTKEKVEKNFIPCTIEVDDKLNCIIDIPDKDKKYYTNLRNIYYGECNSSQYNNKKKHTLARNYRVPVMTQDGYSVTPMMLKVFGEDFARLLYNNEVYMFGMFKEDYGQ